MRAIYSEQVAKSICGHIATGKSLKTTSSVLEIPYDTIQYWLGKHDDFAQRYARARAESADYFAEEIAELADDETIPPESRRIRVDARKWIAAKLKPQKYGDKTILSNDPENPIGSLALRLDTAINRNVIDVTPVTVQIAAPDGSELI